MMSDKIGAEAALGQLKGWRTTGDVRDAIEKTFKFSNFKIAWAFMSSAALKAEQMDHHPEWFNVYNRVEVTLTTHDADGVTEKDIELAVFMDALADKLGCAPAGKKQAGAR